MPAQDDAREQQMIDLFNLTVPPDRTRGGLDALLILDGIDPIPFELKSSTGTSVSTVRDFGPDHIAKWSRLHWLFAFYSGPATSLQYCYYASPADMAGWIRQQESYIRPDLILAERAPQLLTDQDLREVVGDAESYSTADAKAVMKNQWTAKQYLANADLPNGRYSRARMLELLAERCAYVIRRGSTLNNPHIPGKYLHDRLKPITNNHAATLRELVHTYLDNRARQIDAGNQPAEDRLDPVTQSQARAAATDDATA